MKWANKTILMLALVLFLAPSQLFASTPMQACLLAKEECSALQSIKKKTNPGNIHLQVNSQYHIKARNRKNNATHYQIRIDAKPNLRWVPIQCGVVTKKCGITPTPPDDDKPPVAAKDYLLALSWQPAFCQSHQTKKECRHQTSERYDASHFSLHGLWPQPRSNAYCGVISKYRSIDRKKRWDLLPELDLSKNTRTQLKKLMPGYQSNLQRHEWIKHGTCYSETAEEYYLESLLLTEQMNHSGLQALFSNNLGNFISITDIKTQLEQDFGPSAAGKVSVRCDRKGNISELWLNLRGTIDNESSIAELTQSAPNARSNCRNGGGFIDPAGF